MQASVLIVDDESAIRKMISFSLGSANFDVLQAADTKEAEGLIATKLPQLILLDWMLPGMSGIQFARHLKRQVATKDVPIIMLTARDEETDKLDGFNAGVDDYVAKPFSSKELIARIKAVLRRSQTEVNQEVMRIRDLEVDPNSQRIKAMGEPVKLGPTEFRLLHFLMTRPERAFSRTQLLDSVWGTNVYVEERTVDVHIRRIRKQLKKFGYDVLIQTVHGTGYRFSEQPA